VASPSPIRPSNKNRPTLNSSNALRAQTIQGSSPERSSDLDKGNRRAQTMQGSSPERTFESGGGGGGSKGQESQPESKEAPLVGQDESGNQVESKEVSLGQSGGQSGGQSDAEVGEEGSQKFIDQDYKEDDKEWEPSASQKVMYQVVAKIIAHSANTDEEKVFQLCLDIYKEISLIDREVINILSKLFYKLILGQKDDLFPLPEKNTNQILKVIKFLDREKEANHYLQVDAIIGRVVLYHIPSTELELIEPPVKTMSPVYFFLSCWNNGYIPLEMLALSHNDLLNYLPFILNYSGDNFKEVSLYLVQRVLNSKDLGLHIYWSEKVGLYPLSKVKVARGSPSLDSTMGFFSKLSAMPKSTGRKIMLETLTVDPFSGCILKSCEIKYIFNSSSKPLLLELVFQNDVLPPKQVVFKKDEDCRSDFVAQKIFSIFNDIWKCAGFGPVSPSIVTYNVTNIAKDMACYEYSPSVPLSVFSWESIKDLNELEKNTLLHSYAASLIGCYIIGLRDRTLDNILIKEHTSLSLIDFKYLWNTSEKNDQSDKVVVTKFKAFFYADWERLKLICEKTLLVLHKNSSLILNIFGQLFDFESEAYKEKMFTWAMKSLSVGKRMTKSDLSLVVNSLVHEASGKSSLFSW
jgi:hypothetical protein